MLRRDAHEPAAPRTSAGDACRGGAGSEVILRRPAVEDGSELWRLVRESGRLDTNSCYAYLLLCRDFGDTCAVAEAGGELVGFASAYVPPAKPEVLFLWQIAVSERFRGRGIGRRLLHHLLELPAARGSRVLETTVTPSNTASRRLFESLARDMGASLRVQPGFRRGLFRYEEHEDELLLSIEPLKRGTI